MKQFTTAEIFMMYVMVGFCGDNQFPHNDKNISAITLKLEEEMRLRGADEISMALLEVGRNYPIMKAILNEFAMILINDKSVNN